MFAVVHFAVFSVIDAGMSLFVVDLNDGCWYCSMVIDVDVDDSVSGLALVDALLMDVGVGTAWEFCSRCLDRGLDGAVDFGIVAGDV